jgi:hypothetical protein
MASWGMMHRTLAIESQIKKNALPKQDEGLCMWPDPHRCTISLETQYDSVFDEPVSLSHQGLKLSC